MNVIPKLSFSTLVVVAQMTEPMNAFLKDPKTSLTAAFLGA